jgi:hypothetical protein
MFGSQEDHPMPRLSDDTSVNSSAKELDHEPAQPAKDAPVSPQDVAEKPPTRQGGADAGRSADDPGRGGD